MQQQGPKLWLQCIARQPSINSRPQQDMLTRNKLEELESDNGRSASADTMACLERSLGSTTSY